MRQLIIVRKDLEMSAGKMAAQASHASNAFLMHMIKTAGTAHRESLDIDGEGWYELSMTIPEDIYDGWFNDIFTKTICEAKNKNQLMKAVTLAEGQGLRENEDFFLIKDNCLTELEPEEIGEDGVGRTLTCIGFRPLPDDIAHAISRKYQLYK